MSGRQSPTTRTPFQMLQADQKRSVLSKLTPDWCKFGTNLQQVHFLIPKNPNTKHSHKFMATVSRQHSSTIISDSDDVWLSAPEEQLAEKFPKSVTQAFHPPGLRNFPSLIIANGM